VPKLHSLIGAFLFFFAAGSPSVGAAQEQLRVYILAGQSNMEGQAVVDLEGPDYNGGKGTLAALMRDPAKEEKLRHLRDVKGGWRTLNNVWMRYKREEGPLLAGPLSVGYTVYGDKHHFGPELAFGHLLGQHFQSPILLIKTAWGGKSLYRDFRPPSAGGEVGPYYKKMISDVREALANLKTEFPEYDGRPVQLAGFVWYQGWNDGCDPKNAVPEYEENLVRLIKDVRKDLGAPYLPIVIGELTGPWVEAPGEWADLRKAQAQAASRPEFRGNVTFVSTRDFVRKPEESPNPTHGHHEFGNAETYLLVGEALAQAMLKLPWPATGYTTRTIEGWTVHVQESLAANNPKPLSTALTLLKAQLAEIARVVPARAVEKLRLVELWLSPQYAGVAMRAEYHPDIGWLRENGRNPAMAKGVEFSNVPIFEQETRRMPNFALHELAHAYHDRVLGFDQPEVAAAYERARKNGSYDNVERWHGDGRPNTRERAYAMTDQKEYFAEATEAFFSRNDFFPFDREELRRHDPKMENALARLWGVTK
jgi:hypothetical protein